AEIRTSPLNRCAISWPLSIHRRTVRVQTPRHRAISSIVKSFSNFACSVFIALPRVRRCEQSLKRAKRNQRSSTNADRLQFALFDEPPNGGVAEPANLSSG